jgi:hypothetical protein
MDSKGLVLWPNGLLEDLDVYVGANFAGLWLHKDKHDSLDVRSQTELSICLLGLP